MDQGLKIFDLIPVENAENKFVHKIFILTDSPFSKNSHFLTALNSLHINTKDDVIRRDLIQKEGQVFDEAAVRDSEIILRSQSMIRSLAIIVPVRLKTASVPINEDEVYLLVATKDIISLRPSFDFKGSQDLLTKASVALGEYNLLGLNKSVAGIYTYQQSGHTFSAFYLDPRLFGSPFQLLIKPSIILARDSFKYDGFLGDFEFERPLLSEADRYGYGINFSYGSPLIIDFNGKKVRTFRVPTKNGDETVEKKYRWRYATGSIFGRISFGREHKNEVFTSYGLKIKRPSIPVEFGLSDAQRQYVEDNILPKNELESFVTLGYSYFQNRFLKLYDYDNYLLQEIKRTGPSVTVANDFSSKEILFSDHNFLRPMVSFSLTQILFLDSFIQGSISASSRYESEFADNIFKCGLSFASHKMFGLGRLVVESRLSLMDSDRDKQKFVLGSDSGLRGVTSRFYSGEKGFRTNVELRSVPIDLWIFHAGLVLFYDVGAAFDTWRSAQATHALGFGLRLLAPQLSSTLLRIDLAFPIYGPGQALHTVIPSFGTGQAF